MLAAPSCPIPESLLRPAICLGIPEPRAGPSDMCLISHMEPNGSHSDSIPIDSLIINTKQLKEIKLDSNRASRILLSPPIDENISTELLTERANPLELQASAYINPSFSQNTLNFLKINEPQLVTARLLLDTQKCEIVTKHKLNLKSKNKSKRHQSQNMSDENNGITLIQTSHNDFSSHSPPHGSDNYSFEPDPVGTNSNIDQINFFPNHFGASTDGFDSQFEVSFKKEWI